MIKRSQGIDAVLPGRRRASGLITGIALVACLGASNSARAQQGLSKAEDPVHSKRFKPIEQGALLKGRYPLRQVMENGRHLFSTPFTKAEGYGEGGRPKAGGGYEIGPREAMFLKKLDEFRLETKSGLSVEELRQYLNFPQPTVNENTKKIIFPYMRMNGLDSQSCFECHNSIGSERLPDTRSFALTRKQSIVGGPAGSASNAFINDDLPKHSFMFVRNPPHVFGIGYVQELAEEMTLELQTLRAEAIYDALTAAGNMGSRPLKAKTTDYGTFSVTYTGDPNNKPELETVLDQLNKDPNKDPDGFRIDRDQITGVSVDLVVRPFQWKGIASNERNFVRDALQFHFGMQAREKNPHFNTDQEDTDSDLDGIEDEMSVGDVTALTVYTMTVRPPVETLPETDAERRAVEKGRKIFEGSLVFTKEVSCARCHTPSLHLIDTTVVVRDPFREFEKHGPEQIVGNRSGLSAPLKSSAQLPAVRRFMELKPAEVIKDQKDKGGAAMDALKEARARNKQSVVPDEDRRADGYAFDLTTLQPANADPDANRQHAPPLSESLPRLPANGKSVEVPLFSDLRRHKMGNGLKEHDGFRQQTDVAGIMVAEEEFLTRPLWGVGDTGPWLHDGRAQSLNEAILLHESDGSEANDVIEAFRNLSKDEQDAVVKFLLTLRLPLDPRYGFDDYH
jgi:hypothetical protein